MESTQKRVTVTQEFIDGVLTKTLIDVDGLTLQIFSKNEEPPEATTVRYTYSDEDLIPILPFGTDFQVIIDADGAVLLKGNRLLKKSDPEMEEACPDIDDPCINIPADVGSMGEFWEFIELAMEEA